MQQNKSRPVECRLNKNRKTSTLWFESGACAEFYLRGGICWPMMSPGSGLRGFALLVGYDIESGVFNVFEEFPFVTVDHVIDANQVIIATGLSKFLSRCWDRYFASKLYWHDVVETTRKYQLQILRSGMIKNRPALIEAEWDDPLQPLCAILEKMKMGKIRYPAKGMLDTALTRFEQEFEHNPEQKPGPELRALMACIAGMEMHPWRKARFGNMPY